jgi:hypothetical protein
LGKGEGTEESSESWHYSDPAWFDDWRETVKRAGEVDGHERVEAGTRMIHLLFELETLALVLIPQLASLLYTFLRASKVLWAPSDRL